MILKFIYPGNITQNAANMDVTRFFLHTSAVVVFWTSAMFTERVFLWHFDYYYLVLFIELKPMAYNQETY
jgi:hypothetical protein